MKKLIFEGIVRDVENECRVDEGEDGSIYIGDGDVVAEIKGAEFTKNIIVGIADERFSGEHFVETGWGYSEWTPMDEDKLCVGDHDLLEILKRYEGQKITMFVSDEPINILETKKSCHNCVNHVVWEKYEDYDEECWCGGAESQEGHFANCFNFVGETVYDKCQYWEGQEERIVVRSPSDEEPYYVYNRDDVEIVRMGVADGAIAISMRRNNK